MNRWRINLALLVLVVAGCASSKPTTQPVDADERQEKAMNDPMNWKPEFKKHDKSTKRGITEFDKEGFNRDVDKVFNP